MILGQAYGTFVDCKRSAFAARWQSGWTFRATSPAHAIGSTAHIAQQRRRLSGFLACVQLVAEALGGIRRLRPRQHRPGPRAADSESSSRSSAIAGFFEIGPRRVNTSLQRPHSLRFYAIVAARCERQVRICRGDGGNHSGSVLHDLRRGLCLTFVEAGGSCVSRVEPSSSEDAARSNSEPYARTSSETSCRRLGRRLSLVLGGWAPCFMSVRVPVWHMRLGSQRFNATLLSLCPGAKQMGWEAWRATFRHC